MPLLQMHAEGEPGCSPVSQTPALDKPDVAALLAERVEQIITDKGGRDRLGSIKVGAICRYAVLEMHVESWEQYFMRSGLMTPRGRVRSGYAQGYLASVTQLMRLAQIIGLDKVEHQVYQSPREWLEQTADQGGQGQSRSQWERGDDSDTEQP